MITVVVADDHPLMLAGVQATLRQCEEIEVLGTARDGAETLELVRRQAPDLLLLDVEMPGPSAHELVAEARMARPALKVLVLTAHADEASIRRLTRVRISGYMLKDEAPENLLQAVLAVAGGATWFSQTVASKIMGFHDPEDLWNTLTRRERQILQEIARGLDNQAIAETLSLAEQTVRNYASTIYDKLGVASRVEALVWARDRGLV
jgi:DNA-binding NarL/FixJ family response regulator